MRTVPAILLFSLVMFTQEAPRSDFTEHVFEQDFVRSVSGVLKCFIDLTGLREHRGTALCDNRIYRPGSRAMDLGTICYILPSRPAQ
jgi:hypothetical protein